MSANLARAHRDFAHSSLVMMSTFAVSVAVLDFVFRRGANIDDFHIEVQRLASQGMIGVNGDRIVGDLDHGDHPWAVGSVRLELVAEFDLIGIRETIPLHFSDERFVVLPISVFRGDDDFQRLAFGLAGQGLFESGNNIVGPVEINQRLTGLRGVQDIPFVIRKGIVDADNGLIGRLHGENPG